MKNKHLKNKNNAPKCTTQVLVLAFVLSQIMSHEAGKHRQHHFRINFHQIIRQSVDTCSNLTGQRDHIPETRKNRSQVSNDWDEERMKKWETGVSLLGIVEFFIVPQHPWLSSLHHGPLHGAGSDDVDQVDHR